MPGFDKTENEIRRRVKDPNHFRIGTFKRMTIAPGVSIIIGKLKRQYVPKGRSKDATVTQAYRFDLKKFDLKSAKAWFKKHVEDKYQKTIDTRSLHAKETTGLGKFTVFDTNKTSKPLLSKYQVHKQALNGFADFLTTSILPTTQTPKYYNTLIKLLKDEAILRTIDWNGLTFGIEYEVGMIRFDIPMAVMYGKILNYLGNDGSYLDAYLGSNPASLKVFKITQLTMGGVYDEDKFMFWFDCIQDAQNAYLNQMPKQMLGNIIESSMAEVRQKSLEAIQYNKPIDDGHNIVIDEQEYLKLKDIIITSPYKNKQLTDDLNKPVKARILVTQPNIENLNNRQYTSSSLEQAVKDAQPSVDLGLIVGYEEHPDPVYNGNEEPVGYDYTQRIPLFRVTKLWYDPKAQAVYAEAVFFNTSKGIEYSNKIRNKEKVSVSLRALGECVDQKVTVDGQVTTKTVCEVQKIDGFDAVKTPALPTARVIAYSEMVDAYLTKPSIQSDKLKSGVHKKDSMLKSLSDSVCNGATCNCGGVCQKHSSSLLANNSNIINHKINDNDKHKNININMYGGDRAFKDRQDSTISLIQETKMEQILELVKSLGATPEVIAVLTAWAAGRESAMAEWNAEEANEGETENEGMEAEGMPNASEPQANLNPTNASTDMEEKKKDKMMSAMSEKDSNLYDKLLAALSPSKEKDKVKMKDKATYLSKDTMKAKSATPASDALLTPEVMDKLKGMFTEVSKESSPISTDLVDHLKKLVEKDQKEQKQAQIASVIRDMRTTGQVDLDINGQRMQFRLESLPIELLDRLEQDVLAISQDTTTAVKAFKLGVKTLFDNEADKRQQQTSIQMQRNTFNGATGSTVEQHFVQVMNDSQEWRSDFDSLDKAIDNYREKCKPNDIQKIKNYAAVNSLCDRILRDWDKAFAKPLYDNAQLRKKALKDGRLRHFNDAALVLTPNDLRNQPIVSRMFIKQIFQRLIALQFVQPLGPGEAIASPGTSAGPGGGPFGGEFRIPVSSYNGASPVHPKKYVGMQEAIPQATSNVRLISFWAELRALGFAVPFELREQLENGAIGFDPVAMMIDDISADMARTIDTHILEEHQLTCDEFGAVAVVGEVSIAGNTVYNAGGSVQITYDGATVTYGSTVVFAVKALSGATGGIPIVPSRTNKYYDYTGAQQSTVTNPISVTFAATTQVQGYLQNGQIVSFPGTTATFAIDFERGYFLFNAASGANGVLMPTLGYSYATNFVTFDLTPTSGTTPEDYYDGLLNVILQSAANLDQTRFQQPDVCLFPTSIGLGALAISSLFHARKSPLDTSLSPGFVKNDFIGDVAGINIMKTNGQMFAGDRRAILFSRRMVGYGVQTPSQIVGPVNNTITPSGGGIAQLTPGEQWALWLRDVVGTPLVRNASGVVLNHPGITIRFRHNVAYV